ncbi:amino acid/amide ABC transporter substrate-binding protein, HAAT family [Geoalkalibacter ferrihydriticus]|uniref:Ligand-binding receptor n=2 Tax=Geoalkalibacter ferrihydriticus TaxID=392333 RepID=A0A0C2HLZ3_9BACT|nr:ABC transporter substrate-binding protein [Geoalkalibacter ferrihydriticus]KIH78121.1 ligand-binding receptor [Geoalkalibacter ferrihydriticus DSM 17813]SDM79705.1 amino acid/amide ABC transporter substrate-binding protein, HAAT family [Geoalkalibacter ferrihydriticus]
MLRVRVILLLILLLPVQSVYAADILLGMSTALTGPTAELGTAMRDGVLLGLERINRDGGVDGRKLRLVVLDDGYEPARTAPNMRRLIEEKQVLAIIGNVGTPTAIASLPVIREHRVLFFAPFTGAGVLRQTPPERYVINLRAGYTEEIDAMVDALVRHGGLQPEDIAFFTQRDGYGDSGYVSGFSALRRHGLADERQVLHVRYPRNTLAVENALADVLLAEKTPRAIIMVGAYDPCAKFVRLAREAGLESLFLSVSFVGGDFLAEALGPGVEGVVVTQVVPHPRDRSLRVVDDYLSDLHSLAPELSPTFAAMEGYLAARLLGLGLARVQGVPSRESLIDALETLGRIDLGLGRPLQLGPQRHQASDQVWPTLLRQGRLMPMDWPQIADLVPERP